MSGPEAAWELPVSDPGAAKACCAAAYGSDAATLLLGSSYHPGGAELTRRLAQTLELGPHSAVLDVASGRGTTALQLAREHGCSVRGIDLGARQVGQATAAATQEGLGHLAAFSVADAERLPFAEGSFDAVVCECALCTFPDKARAVEEFARVLGPDGRVGITDVTVWSGRLPASLADMASWIACIADARSPEDYEGLLTRAGLEVERVEDHSQALLRMLDQIDARLAVLAMAAPSTFGVAHIDSASVRSYTAAVRAEIHAGTIGYCLITARKPNSQSTTTGGPRP